MIATRCETADAALVAAVRAGEETAFEELYRRYQRRIALFVRGMLRDEARAEDVTQEAFLSALRRLRATAAEIDFKPWIYEIARNAAIDSYRRARRSEEVSMDADERLRPSDRLRLVGDPAPDSRLMAKERLDHLRGAFDELSRVQLRVLVMRELEGFSYREIGERLDLSRPAVESALFRARRRLESEYAELAEGRRCQRMRAVIARLAEGLGGGAEQHRLARHARRCHACRRRARELGVDPLGARTGLGGRVAALLPLPLSWLPTGAQAGAGLSERAAALIAAAALAGAGGLAVGGSAVLDGGPPPAPGDSAASEQRAPAPVERTVRGGRAAAQERRPALRRAPRRAAERDRAPRGGAPAADAAEGGPSAPTGAPSAPERSGTGADVPQVAVPDMGGAVPETEGPELTPAPDLGLPSVPDLDLAPRAGVPQLPLTDAESLDEAVDGAVDGLSGTVDGLLP